MLIQSTHPCAGSGRHPESRGEHGGPRPRAVAAGSAPPCNHVYGLSCPLHLTTKCSSRCARGPGSEDRADSSWLQVHPRAVLCSCRDARQKHPSYPAVLVGMAAACIPQGWPFLSWRVTSVQNPVQRRTVPWARGLPGCQCWVTLDDPPSSPSVDRSGGRVLWAWHPSS